MPIATKVDYRVALGRALKDPPTEDLSPLRGSGGDKPRPYENRENLLCCCGAAVSAAHRPFEHKRRARETRAPQSTKQSVEVGQVGGGAAGFEEFAGAVEVAIRVARDQCPRQLQPALEPLKDLDRRAEVLARRLLISPRCVQLPSRLQGHALPVRHVGFTGGFEGGFETVLGLVELAGGDEGLADWGHENLLPSVLLSI